MMDSIFLFFFISLVFVSISAHDIHGKEKAVARSIRDSGRCGDNVTWSYEESTGTLSLTGSTAMEDFDDFSSPWYSKGSSVKKIIIENGVLSIGKNAFQGLSGVETVTIPSSVTKIGYSAFYECRSLASVTIPETVEVIGTHAFRYCESLTTVKIPSSVTSIGSDPFGFCFKLESIIVDTPNDVYKSASGVLIDKKQNLLIQYPAGKKGDYNISSEITSIGYGAFEGSHGLKSVIIPSSVNSLGASAFEDCSNLTSIVIPESISFIDDGTFYRCSSLRSITLPESITSIGNFAFSRCESLVSIVIPSSVDTIGDYIFSKCSSLEFVSYQGSYDIGASSSYVFEDCSALSLICVPNSYSSTTFCGEPFSCRSVSCGALQQQINDCFEVVNDEGQCIIQEKADVKAWEDRTNGCMQYQCVNESGKISWKTCKGSADSLMTCVDGECVDEYNMTDKKWAVDIVIPSTDPSLVSADDIALEVSRISNINVSEITIGIDYDDEGYVVRVIVYVTDKSSADVIVTSLKEMDKGDTCEGILCRSQDVHQREITQVRFLSEGHRIHAITVMSIIMLFITLF